jgi:hypothetical protein
MTSMKMLIAALMVPVIILIVLAVAVIAIVHCL